MSKLLPCKHCDSDNLELIFSDPFVRILCLDCCQGTISHGDLESAIADWNGV